MSSKSKFSNLTSKSYAIALYELSKENSELDKIELEIKSLQKLINESLDFRERISTKNNAAIGEYPASISRSTAP